MIERRSGTPQGKNARAVWHRPATLVVEALDMVKHGTAPLDAMNRLRLTDGQRLEVCRRVEMMRRLTL